MIIQEYMQIYRVYLRLPYNDVLTYLFLFCPFFFRTSLSLPFLLLHSCIHIPHFMSHSCINSFLLTRSGIGLTPHDFDHTSDPYLVLKISGKKVASTRGNYKPNTNDPDFFQGFEFPVYMPGDSTLTVELWDYDGKCMEAYVFVWFH
jgi:hypothetical protein